MAERHAENAELKVQPFANGEVSEESKINVLYAVGPLRITAHIAVRISSGG